MLRLPAGRALRKHLSRTRAGDAPAPVETCWGTPHIFQDFVVGNFCNKSYVTLKCLLRHRLGAEVRWEIRNITILLGSLATYWKSHHRPSAFQCEHVPANDVGSDKLVKWCRLTFAPGECCLYLGKSSDIRMIHLLLQASYSVFLQVKSNSCHCHEKQEGRQSMRKDTF